MSNDKFPRGGGREAQPAGAEVPENRLSANVCERILPLLNQLGGILDGYIGDMKSTAQRENGLSSIGVCDIACGYMYASIEIFGSKIVVTLNIDAFRATPEMLVENAAVMTPVRGELIGLGYEVVNGGAVDDDTYVAELSKTVDFGDEGAMVQEVEKLRGFFAAHPRASAIRRIAS